jgi:hypothetical protein
MATTCAECGKYDGHFSWCSRSFTVDELFAAALEDINSVPFPDMPLAETALSRWERAS